MSRPARNVITEVVKELGADITRWTVVGGGDINNAARAELADGRTIFVKSHDHAPYGMFEAEADGLAWLAEGPLRVPRVIAFGDTWLALEWLDLEGRPDSAKLGRGLAALHQLGAPSFGYARENFLATLPQDNAAEVEWIEFYVERRLRPLCRRANLDVDRELDRLRRCEDRFGPAEPPARLHGDLWWGNVGSCAGEPVLIDPAVYGGHREVDLAMLALFGGLPDELVDAYGESFPLAEGWRERIELHQLYPLAAHACLFGGGYAADVRRVLASCLA
jgi:fructosamine-3-kinase